jgi:uncharacterized protein (DUF1015 family)
MPQIRPFRALRPEPSRAADVSAVPYDVVSTEEAAQLAENRPLSFLHVSRAEIDLPPETDPHADRVYATARENYHRLIRDAPMVRETEPTLYVYRLRMGDHVQTGVAGTFSLADYDHDVILKHEKTRKDKEDDRTRHMLELQAQTGPVFLTYRTAAVVDRAVATVTAEAPLLDFAAADGVAHTIWKATPAAVADLVTAFGQVPCLYIADGHHRAASAARAREALGPSADLSNPWDWFLGVAFPHDQVQVLAYNRVVKDFPGTTPGEVLARLRESHGVTSGPALPARKGEVSMFLAGQWYNLELHQPADPASPIAVLDVSRLQDQVLAPVFGIGDPRTDKRIEFVGGARGTAALERAVGAGAAAAFSMSPVSVAELMAISDAGEIMPPKSTWFEPKLRDGLVIHELQVP